MFHKMILKIIFNLIIICFLLINFQACNNEDNIDPVSPAIHERGEIVQSNSLGTMRVNDIQQLLADGNMTNAFTLNYSVETISINYYTTDGDGNQTIASGALFIPEGGNNLSLVSIQHGTQTKGDLAASVLPVNSTEGIFGLIILLIKLSVVLVKLS
jgi:hypothetical protein